MISDFVSIEQVENVKAVPEKIIPLKYVTQIGFRNAILL